MADRRPGRTLLVGLVACAALAACAGPTVPMASPASDAEGKTFAPPPPGKAALYVAAGQIADVQSISLGRSEVGSLTGHTWLRVDLDPGSYEIHARSAYSESSLAVALGPGTLTFTQLQYVDLRPWSDVLSPAAPREGRALVLAGKRVAQAP
jgi:hypothetical protein